MKNYSDSFATLYDETAPVGYLGRGTHYSILRAVVWHNSIGDILDCAKYHDFAIIWDEDHDDRVINVIEKIYHQGLLPKFLFFGERKGSFTALTDSCHMLINPDDNEELFRQINDITENQNDTGDIWPAEVASMVSAHSIINAPSGDVELYLGNIQMLWKLGSKTIQYKKSELMSQIS